METRETRTREMIEFQGFNLLELRVLPDSQHCHTVFVKKHSLKKEDPEKPQGKTLFLLNIPPYVTEENLKFCFGKAGEVQKVIFDYNLGTKNDEQPTKNFDGDKFCRRETPFMFRSAYVVFCQTKSLSKAIKMPELKLYDEYGKTVIVSGVQKWEKEQFEKVQSEEVLQKEIDEFMADYDKKEKEASQAEKEAEADEDGWITVTKRGKNAGFEQKESVINKIEKKMKKSKKERQLKNFYTFQIRESKMQHIVNLRKKFEDDKQRIELMKKSRKFNPFK